MYLFILRRGGFGDNFFYFVSPVQGYFRMNGKTERREKQREVQSDREMIAYIQASVCTTLK